MGTVTSIDAATWARREQFEYYSHRVPCTYALTVELDVTQMVAALRDSTRKTYVAQVWALAAVVNRHEPFRMALTESGEPGIWDRVDPMFTVLNPERETFSCVWTPFDRDFARFHDAAAELLASHRGATSFFPQGEPPPNTFDISSLPWTSFTGFSLQIDGGQNHLLPIFTLGRYIERDARTLLPVAVQIHHAAADGFHTARLIDDLQHLVEQPGWLA
jgi:chloramphenicol O-acetyltransferase type A